MATVTDRHSKSHGGISTPPPVYTATLLTYIADTYRATYPQEQARIARAVALVDAGHVTLDSSGVATVRSQHGQAIYHVNGQCDCEDQAAPEGRCKHRFAKVLARHLACLSHKARYALYLDPLTVEQVPGIAWPSLDGLAIHFAPDEDTYPTRAWTCAASTLVLLARIEA